MSTIKASCPACGDVLLTGADIVLYLPAAADEDGRYGFTCPACRTYVCKPADPHVVSLLLSGGVVAHATPGALTAHDLTRLRQALLLVDELSPIALEEMTRR